MLTFAFLLTILIHGYCLDNDGQLDNFENACIGTEAICLLQSSVKVKNAQTSKFSDMSALPLERFSDDQRKTSTRFSLLSTASKQGVRVGIVDEKVKVLLGLLGVLVVGACMTVACLLFKSKDEEEAFLIHPDMKKQVTKKDLTESRRQENYVEQPTCLSATFVVTPQSEVLYYIPVISKPKKPIEAFQITDTAGRPVMGVLVKDSDDDPGILIHRLAASPGEAGVPIAFIDIHPDALRKGKLRIAIPSSQHQRGTMFGMLERVGESFTVARNGEAVLWIENQFITGNWPIFALTAGANGGGKEFGTSSRRGDHIEVSLKGDADGALAVICLLAIQRMQ